MPTSPGPPQRTLADAQGPGEEFAPKLTHQWFHQLAERASWLGVIEELFENGIEAIRNRQRGQLVPTPGNIKLSMTKNGLTLSDDGIGMAKKPMDDVFGPHKKVAKEGGLMNVLAGWLGEFGQGLKCIFKYGDKEHKQEVLVKTKSPDSASMKVASVSYDEVVKKGMVMGKEWPNCDLDPVFFGTDDSQGDPMHFVGPSGTVIKSKGFDAGSTTKLLEERNQMISLLPEHQAHLAGKYIFFMTPGAMAFFIEAFQASSSEARPDCLPRTDFEKIVIGVPGCENLQECDNAVKDRLLDLLADSSHVPAAWAAMRSGQRFSLAPEGEVPRMKRSWARIWDITNADGETASALALLYIDSPSGERDESVGSEAGSDSSDDGLPAILVVWCGLVFQMDKNQQKELQLPFLLDAQNKAKRTVKPTFGLIKGIVFLPREFRPNPSKTWLSQEALDGSFVSELQEMKLPANKKLKERLRDELLEQVKMWTAQDTTEEYGKILKTLDPADASDGVKYLRADVQVRTEEPAGGPAAAGRSSTRHKMLKYEAGKSFVEAEVRRPEPGQGKKGAVKTVQGKLEELITSFPDETGNPKGLARIKPPYQESVVVLVAQILKLVPEKKVREALESRLPAQIKLWLHVPEAACADEELQKKCGICRQEEAPYLPWDPDEAFIMTADQAGNFQMMLELVDRQARVVEHGGQHSRESLLDLSNEKLSLRLELLDDTGVAIKDRSGQNWFDVRSPQCRDRNNRIARYFSDMRYDKKNRTEAINDMLKMPGTYKVRATIDFRKQPNKCLMEELRCLFSSPPIGVMRVDVKIVVVPAKPWKAQIKPMPTAETYSWLGETLSLPVGLFDKFSNELAVSDAISAVSCSAIEGADGFAVVCKMEDEECRAEIDGKAPLPTDPVKLHLQLEARWKDPSSVASALGLCGPSAVDLVACSPSIHLMGGKPHTIKLDVPAGVDLQELERSKPLPMTVRVLDRWGRVFQGKPGQLVFNLKVSARNILDESGISLDNLVDGTIQLQRDAVRSLVAGCYGAQGKLCVECTTVDHRVSGTAGEKVTAEYDVGVETVQLSFKVPPSASVAEDDEDGSRKATLHVQGRERLQLDAVKLQLLDGAGLVMEKVSLREGLYMRKAGSPTRTLLEVKHGEVELKGHLDKAASAEYEFSFPGLTATLAVELQHGPPRAVQVDPQTNLSVTVGQPWDLFFTVRDDNDLAVTTQCFDIEVEPAAGVSFRVIENSVVYHPDKAAFKARVIPEGLVGQQDSASNSTEVLFHLRPHEHASMSAAAAGSSSLGSASSSLALMPPAPPEESMQAGVNRTGRVSCAMKVKLGVGPATKLHFMRGGETRTQFSYVSGAALNMTVVVGDDFGNVDVSYSEPITITITEDGSEEQRTEQIRAEKGKARVQVSSGDELALFTQAAKVELTASMDAKKSKTTRSALRRPQQQQRLEGACELQVTRGKWACRFELEHPKWNEAEQTLEMDDSHLELDRLGVRVVADDGSLVQHAQLRLGLPSYSRRSSTLVFGPLPIPAESGMYDASLELVDDEPQQLPPLNFKIHRKSGVPASVVLTGESGGEQVAGEALEVCAKMPFALYYEVRNRLGVGMPLRDLEQLCKANGTEFRVEFKLQGSADALRMSPGKKVTEQGSLGKYQLKVEEVTPLERKAAAQVQAVVVFQGTQLRSNAYALAITPTQGVADKQRIQEMNKKKDELQKLQKEREKDTNEQTLAAKEIQRLNEELEGKMRDEQQLRAQEQAVEAELKGLVARGRIPSTPTLLADANANPPLARILKAREEDAREEDGTWQPASMPAGFRVLGVAAELGFVDEGCEEASKRVAAALAALAGPRMQAVVVAREAGAASVALEAGGTELLHGALTLLVVWPGGAADGGVQVDPDGRVVFVVPPPTGAHYAVNKVKFEGLRVPGLEWWGGGAGEAAGRRDVAAALRARVWWPILKDALIFDTMETLEKHLAQPAAAMSAMAAQRADGSWRVVDADFVIPTVDAQRCVELGIAQPAETTRAVQDKKAELRALKRTIEGIKELQQAQNQYDAATATLDSRDFDSEEQALKDQLAAFGVEENDEGGGHQGGSSSSKKRKLDQTPVTAKKRSLRRRH